jgi:Ca-activated chloride channel family protein
MHLTAHLDIDLLALAADEDLTCHVELVAPTPPETTTRPGMAVVVVLDRSGSMGGGPLETAQRAISDLVRRLSPQDMFGLVTFHSEVDIPVPVGRLSDRPLNELLAAIAAIRPGGRTDLSAGYLMGLREAERALMHRADVRGTAQPTAQLSGATVLLLSDGHANAGITDPDRLADVAAKAHRANRRRAATTTSTLGLGQGYDEVILAALARGGSGEHRYAPDSDAATAEFTGLVDDLLSKSVTGALLRVLPQQGLVDVITVHGALPNWPDGDAVVVNLGDLYSGEERQVLVGLHVPALPRLGTATVADLELSYTSLPDLTVHTVTLPVSVNVVPGDEARGRIPDARVSVARLLLEADDAKRTAAERLRDGDTATAQQSLTDAITRVRAGRLLAGTDAALGARIDDSVTDLEDLAQATRQYSNEWAGKLAMESWNQTNRGKVRRMARWDPADPRVHSSAPSATHHRLPDGNVLLVVGDIIEVARREHHDALVNTTNEHLNGGSGGSGLAGAIHAAAGPELAAACRRAVVAGPLAIGDAVATPGYGVGVRHIVHTVGPRYLRDMPCDELLATAHRRAIEVADALGCTSIAIPAIATGARGYPIAEAAPIALRAVGEALQRSASVSHVTFVLPDEATLNAYRTAATGG